MTEKDIKEEQNNENLGENKISEDMAKQTEKNGTDTKIKKDNGKLKRNLVLVVLAITLLITYIIQRGEYLEIKEIGENYISIFWQNFKYTTITAIINFIFIFGLMYTTTKRIKLRFKNIF